VCEEDKDEESAPSEGEHPIQGRACNNWYVFFFLVEEAYTQQWRAHIRRLHPDWAARPALMSRAAHAVKNKAVVRIKPKVFLLLLLV
jgi:hypothetical protein